MQHKELVELAILGIKQKIQQARRNCGRLMYRKSSRDPIRVDPSFW